MANIEVSEKTYAEFTKLLEELNKVYPNQKLSNDVILEAMIGGFIDSLTYMKQQAEAGHAHHHHDHDGCCGGSDDCENKKDGQCCGHHH